MDDFVTSQLANAFSDFAYHIIGTDTAVATNGDELIVDTSLTSGLISNDEEIVISQPAEEEVTYPSFDRNLVASEGAPPLPENSSTLLMDETTSRFSSAIWYNKIQEQVIILAGLGGIGSYTAFLLGRMKPRRLVLYDDDVVEVGNMSGQMFSSEYIGTYKVSAISSILYRYSDYYTPVALTSRYQEDTSYTEKIMICGFDNMEARKIFYNKWKDFVFSLPVEERKECLFIDGRLAAEELQVLCITGEDSFNMERYEADWLFADNEAEATICSYKQTSYMANMIGSLIVNLFTNFCANMCNPLIPRDLPFFTSYDATMMYFKTEV